jgi:hypothetical protein
MEAAGAWLRLDHAVEPAMFHAATVSEGELHELRRIRDIVRLGRARALEADRVLLDRGEIHARAGTLYVDCTAAALARPQTLPVFAGNRITIQMVRLPQLPFSAALIAFLEATIASDDEKNRFVAPIRIPDTVEEYVAQLVPDTANRDACNRHPAVREFIGSSRTDGFARVMRDVRPDDIDRLAILNRLRQASKQAAENLPRLLATLE